MQKYPIDAVLRNGNHIFLHNVTEAQTPGGRNIFGGLYEGLAYDVYNDIVTLPAERFNLDKNVTIHGAMTNGDITGIFVDNTYKELPVKNKIVLDIGANIGDSAIYFALNGAKKVFCIEPIPINYKLAQKNIKLNNFSDKINIILAGCSSERGGIMIDPAYSKGSFSRLKDFKSGIVVPLLTIEDILNEYNLSSDRSLILKIDCEGCEYDCILYASEYTLQKFNHIMIEYHHGYINLKKKLEKSGFRVSVTRPRIEANFPNNMDENSKLAIGNIFATRN